MTARVECCGVPASGKSTLCAGALRLLKARGHVVWGREAMVEAGLRARDFGALGNFLGAVAPGWRRDFLGMPRALSDWHRFAVDHPDFVALLHEWLAEREGDEPWRDAVFYSLLTSAFEFQLARQVRNPVLLDEGFAQRFFSLRGYRGRGRPGDAARYAAAMPLPSALIWVDAPPAVCLERIRARDHAPILLAPVPEGLWASRFAEGREGLAALAEEMARRGVPVLRADGAGDPGIEAGKIADFAERQQ